MKEQQKGREENEMYWGWGRLLLANPKRSIKCTFDSGLKGAGKEL